MGVASVEGQRQKTVCGVLTASGVEPEWGKAMKGRRGDHGYWTSQIDAF